MKRGLLRLLAIACAVLAAGPALCLAAHAAPAPADALTLYVSPAGDDAAAGTREAPLHTPAGAQRKLREMKSALPDGARVTVLFAGGRYEFADTLVFTAADVPNVTFAAAGDGPVIFSGARTLSGFEAAEANGVAVFRKRLTADEADFGSVFSGETQLSTPRWPAEGYFTVKDTCPEDDLWTSETTPWEFTLGQRSFYGDPADLTLDLSQPEAVCVRILHYWHDELAFLTGYDRASGKLSLSRPSSMRIRDIDRYYFENVFEMLREPGQWYLDKAENIFYYVPREGESPDTLTLRVSSLERLAEIGDADGLRFENIRFAETDWRVPSPGATFGDWRAENDIDALQAAMDVKGVVTVRHAQDIAFTNCEFLNLGASGLKLAEGVRHSRVENCRFENIAATAVFAGGANCRPDEPDHTGDITVRNNLVRGYGRRFFCAIGVQITYCDGARVENNEICSGFYTGISCGWVWGYGYHATKNISIKNNLIYDIGQGWLSDMGGIYMLGRQPGTVISGNVIHNVAADPGEGGYGGWGVYLDEGSSFITVEQNLVFCCGSQGLNIHYGEGNIIRNNISALSAGGQASVGSRGGEPHATAFYYNNIFVTEGLAPIYVHMKDTAHFYENGNLFWNVTDPGALTFAKTGDKDLISLRQAKKEGFIHNETVADPLFRDIERFDFATAADSPALALNFIPWDYSQAGTLKDTVLGLGIPGGQTPYAAGAHKNAPERFAKSVLSGVSLPAAAALLGLLSLLTAAACALRAAPDKVLKTLLIVTFCLAAGAAVYRFFVYWAPVPYVLACLALYAAAALLPLPPAEKTRKKAAVTYAIRFAAVFAAEFGLTLLLNNLLRVGEPIAVGAALALLAGYVLFGTLRSLRGTGMQRSTRRILKGSISLRER